MLQRLYPGLHVGLVFLGRVVLGVLRQVPVPACGEDARGDRAAAGCLEPVELLFERLEALRRDRLPVGGAEAHDCITDLSWQFRAMAEMRQFFRDNPQVLILLIICVVLGVGTFLAVILGVIGAGSLKTTGEPSGLIVAAQALMG